MAYPKGIDVASYQTSTFSLSGLSFVFVKCTESNNYVNPKYAAQVAHVRTNKAVVLGHYLFQRPGSVSAQADYFLAHASIKAGDLIALDWEDSGVSGSNKDAMLAYLEAKRPKNRVVLYCNLTFWKTKDTTSKCGDGLWIAAPSDPDGKPSITHAWTFQQTGISGTDIDIYNGTAAGLKTWATSKGAVTPPKPKPTPTPTPKPEPTVSEASEVAFLYDNLGKIKRKDNGDQHAAGYFLATNLDETEKASAKLDALVIQVQQIHDKLFAAAPTAANPEQSEARHAGR